MSMLPSFCSMDPMWSSLPTVRPQVDSLIDWESRGPEDWLPSRPQTKPSDDIEGHHHHLLSHPSIIRLSIHAYIHVFFLLCSLPMQF